MRKPILILFFLISLNIWAQEIIVVDQQNNPISSVAVYNKSKTVSSLSDQEGTISLSRFFATDTLFFQHPSYKLKKLERQGVGDFVRLELAENILSVINLQGGKNINNIKNVAEKKIYISPNEIRELSSANIADVLEKKGGISVQKSQMGGGSPNIRGFEANKVLLMLDGVRLNNAIYRSGHLQNIITIDEYMLEDIEVIFGPSSVLYGSDALGGTINMSTKKLNFSKKKSWNNGASSAYSSAYNSFKTNIFSVFETPRYSTTTSFSWKKFGDLIMGSWRQHGYENWGLVHHYVDGDSVVCNSNPNIQRGTGYSQYDLFNKILLKLNNNWRLSTNVQYSNSTNIPRFDKLNDNDQPCTMGSSGVCSSAEGLKFHSYYYGPQKRFFSSLKLTGFNHFLDKSEFIIAYQNIAESRHKWYLDDFLDYINGDGSAESYDPPTHQYETVDIYSLNTNHRKGSVRFGSETSLNKVTSKTTDNGENNWAVGDTRYPPDGSGMFSSALYINTLQKLSQKLQLELGGRYTFSHIYGSYPDSMSRPVINIEGLNLSTSKNILSGNLKILFYPNNSWKISAVTARGFHTPNIDDMLKVFKKGDNITIPNIHLKPEYSLSQEIAVSKSFDDFLTLYGVGFYTRMTNAIIKDTMLINLNPNANEPPMWSNMIIYDDELVYTFANQNSNRALDIYGLTIGFEGQKNGLEIRGDWNITNSINHDLNGGPIAHIPPTFGKLELLQTLQRWKIKISLLYSGYKKANEFDEAGVDNLDETPFIGDTINSENPEWAGLPMWWTLNFFCKYKLKKNINLQLAIENIMDMHYKTFGSGISAPGRNLILSANCVF